MAGSGRRTFTAGEVLSATNVQNYLMDQAVMVFAGTAARSSAIATPSEGMFSYQTDDNTLELYTGTSWTQLTEEAAKVDTTQSTTSASYVDLATVGPAITIRTGTTALINLSTYAIANAGKIAIMSFAISGATTLAASDTNAVQWTNQSATINQGTYMSRYVLVTGLTAGVNTFTCKYRTDAGTTSFGNRTIVGKGLPE